MYAMSKERNDNINQLIPLIDQRIDTVTTPRFEQLLVEIRTIHQVMDERFKRVDEQFRRVDDKFLAMQKQMDIRFTQVDKRFDQFLTFYRWQFGIIFLGFLGLYLKLFF
jgi:hypothetical protein